MTDAIALKRTLEVLHASDGTTYVLRGGADAEFKIERSTARERDLLDLLIDGAPSAADLRERLEARGHPVDPGQLDTTLEELAGLGLLEEPPAAPALGEIAAERYDRQLAYFADLRPGDSVALQQRLGAAHVAMVGVGGLGTWTAAALACAGVGHLTLVDDDRVELSNLNRQFLYRHSDLGRLKAEAAADTLAAFDPALELEILPRRVDGPGAARALAARHDVIVELADRPPHELSRWLDAACFEAGVTRISAAQFPPLLRIGPTYVPGRTACLLCQEHGARDGFPLYDEFVAMRRARLPVTSTLGSIAAMIGAAVAGDVVHHLTGLMDPASLGTALILDVRDLSVRREPIERRPGCPRCG